MKKQEFLYELRTALEGRLPQERLNEVLADMEYAFSKGDSEGKTEETIALEIGSPAGIARTLLDGYSSGGGQQSNCGPGPDTWQNGQRPQQNSQDAWQGGPDPTWQQGNPYGQYQQGGSQGQWQQGGPQGYWQQSGPQANDQQNYRGGQWQPNADYGRYYSGAFQAKSVPANQASMGKRLAAYVVDGLILGVICGLFLFLIYISTSALFHSGFKGGHHSMYLYSFFDGVFMLAPLLILLGITNLFTTICIWATNGFTPGKWMLGIRVEKKNGEKLTFLDALLRDFVIKGLANGLTSGLLNIGSFIWGCATPNHMTLQDAAAGTAVVNVPERRGETRGTNG